MKIEPDLIHETARLEALAAYGILDTEAEPAFDAITRAASLICGTPLGLVSLVDDRRQWFKSAYGMSGLTETPREIAFCSHTIQTTDILEVPDAREDPRFQNNPLVQSDPHIRFYAGAPLTDAEGFRLGALCVIDFRPGELSESQRASLDELSKVVVRLIQHRRAQDALRESEERFRGSFESAAHGIALVSPDGKWLAANPALCRMVGYSEAELQGLDFQSITHPDDLETDLSHVCAILAGEIETFQIEKRYRHKDGHLVWCLLSASLVRTRTGRPLHFVSHIQNISEQKHHEAALITAHAQAEQANRAKSAFLASMSHEIRTPLNGVIGCADLLLDSPLSPQQHDHVIRMHGAGKSLLALVNDILDISKIEAGKLELERIAINPALIIDSAASIVETQITAKGLKLRVVNGPDVPRWIEGDPTRLRQILLNFLSNALKFTNAGHVTLRCRPMLKFGKRQLLFEVEDSGIGIAADPYHLLFQDFSQVDPSTTRRHGGTGLGLSICKRLAEAMGGEVGIQSEVGAGSVFWFSIALVETVAPAAPLIQAAQARTVVPIRILVAEDLEINQFVINGMLAAEGHTVTIVNNGVEALAAVNTSDFDLVLMDMEMPEMDGLSATRYIRQLNHKARDIPIVALTANAMLEDEIKCRESGMNDFLSKPVNRAELSRVIALWTGPAAKTSQPAAKTAIVQQVAVLDENALLNLERLVGPEKAAEIIQIFRARVSQMVPVLDSQSDRTAMTWEIHNIISFASNIGCIELTKFARDLLTMLQGDSPDAKKMSAIVIEAAQRAIAALDLRAARTKAR